MFVCLCFTAKPRRLFISICHYNKYHRYTLTHLDIHACRCLNVECFSFKFRRKHFCCICDAAVVVCCPLLAGRRVAAIVATFSWPLLLLMQRGGVHVSMCIFVCLCVCVVAAYPRPRRLAVVEMVPLPLLSQHQSAWLSVLRVVFAVGAAVVAVAQIFQRSGIRKIFYFKAEIHSMQHPPH